MRRAPQPHRHPKELEQRKEADSFTGFDVDSEPSDLKIVNRTELEDRAKQIRLSKVPVLATEKGRIRVARNNLKSVDHVQPADSDPTNNDKIRMAEDHPGYKRRVPVYSPPRVASPAEPKSAINSPSRTQLQDASPTASYNYFAQPKITGKSYEKYDYKPPAAAKYFLWDSTRTGLTHILKTKDIIFLNAHTTEVALKNMRMELLKRHLISSQSDMAISREAGFLLGKVEAGDMLCLKIDRFDSGIGTPMNPDTSSPSCKVDTDVLIRVINQENMDEISYFDLIQDALKLIGQPPILDIHTPFPIYANVIFTPNEMDYFPMICAVIPSFNLEIYPIHPIRLVNTELSFRLVAGVQGLEFGYIAIDQARQLYLLEHNEPLSMKIPLVGVWCTNLPSVNNHILHSLILKYIMSLAIQKLDTGKNTLLLCHFPNSRPSRPVCYECTFKPNDVPYEIYGTDFNSALGEFKLLEDHKVNLALNQIFNLTLETHDNTPREAGNDPADAELIKEPLDITHSFKEEETVELSRVQEPKLQELEQQHSRSSLKEDNIEEKHATNSTNEESTNEKGFQNNSTPINPVEQAQQMYINLLEQQIINLQNQLINMGQAMNIQKSQLDSEKTTKKIESKHQDVQTNPVATNDQSSLATPECRTIGVNTDLTFNPVDNGNLMSAKDNLLGSNGIEKLTVPSVLESDLKQMNFPSVTLPSDNGQNFVVAYPNESLDTPKQESSATKNSPLEGKDIITNLVNNPEESFIYTDADTETGSDNSVINLPKKSRNQRFYLPRNEAASEAFSFPMEVSEAEEKSYSFATLNYLSKYGLNNL